MLALLAALGLVAAVVVGFSSAPDPSATPTATSGVADPDVGRPAGTGSASVATLLTVLTTAARRAPGAGLARDGPPVRRAGRRGAAGDREPAPEEQENLDLWKAMDEGRDPTA